MQAGLEQCVALASCISLPRPHLNTCPGQEHNAMVCCKDAQETWCSVMGVDHMLANVQKLDSWQSTQEMQGNGALQGHAPL